MLKEKINKQKKYIFIELNLKGYKEIIEDTAKAATIQLDYYKSIGVTTDNYSGTIKNYNGSVSYWWLRSAVYSSTYIFYYVLDYGDWNYHVATNPNGVAVAFRIG